MTKLGVILSDIGSNLASLKRMYDRMQRTKHIFSNNLSCLKFISKLIGYLLEDTSNVICLLCTQIVSLNKTIFEKCSKLSK